MQMQNNNVVESYLPSMVLVSQDLIGCWQEQDISLVYFSTK